MEQRYGFSPVGPDGLYYPQRRGITVSSLGLTDINVISTNRVRPHEAAYPEFPTNVSS